MMKRNRELAKKYAGALIAIATEANRLEEVETQLVAVRDAVRENRELSRFLYHPMLAREAKKEVVEKLFADTVDPLVVRFLAVVIDRGRIDLLEEIVDMYVLGSQAARNVQEAVVRTAIALTDEEERELIARLNEVTGKSVYLTTTVDPSILGGMIVTIGDRMIDGSMTRQLQEMKATLLKQDANELR